MIDSNHIPYVLLFLVVGIPALVMDKRLNRIAWPTAWVVFVLFVGLRHQIGGDWGNYVRKTDLMGKLPLVDAIQVQDPLFSLLSRVAYNLGWGVYGANLVGAVIFCIGLFAYCARRPNRWLAVAAATPFLVVAGVMSASRQGIAIGMVLFVLARWQEIDLTKKLAGIVLAGFFHASAFIILLLTIVDLRTGIVRKGAFSVLVLAGTLWLMSQSDTGLDQYARLYVYNQAAYAPGAAFHLALNLVPALAILATRKWWAKRVPDWPVIRSLCLVALALGFLVPFFSQAVSRMSFYLFPISITFFAWLPQFAAGQSGRALLRMLTVASLAAVLIVWVGYSNQAEFYRPYQNALTTSAGDLDLPRK